jgi:DNA mismatch repair protein MutL
MADVIQLLPDAVANQIAAGEVVQRPASVVKELLENGIDAGADQIKLIVKEAGKALIQVIDNGCGMSETDARLSFERHATSKIKTAEDLFAIRTMGFRGEALASIAAVAQVELKTRRQTDELGVRIVMEGSELKVQEACQTAPGTSISMRNLFYNTPARRNFLKSNAVEMRHIIEEFQRVAIAYPEIFFSLHHNQEEIFHLPASNLRQRLVGIFGPTYNKKLVPVHEETDALTISGFVGKPEFARKTRGEQLFFINKRFIKNAYLNHAVMNAFEDLLPDGSFPLYVICLDIDPAHIDVNVHPTKQEIKFDDERLVYNFLRVAVRHALGSHNITPSLDFEQENSLPDMSGHYPNHTPRQDHHTGSTHNPNMSSDQRRQQDNLRNWQQLYQGFSSDESTGHDDQQATLIIDSAWDEDKPAANNNPSAKEPFQVHQTYIISQIKSGVMLIDQQAAHERILYEQYLEILNRRTASSQHQLFPRTITLPPADSVLLKEMLPLINLLGFDIQELGQHVFVINGLPAELAGKKDELLLLESLLEQFRENTALQLDHTDNLARSMAKSTAVRRGTVMSTIEMQSLIDRLFACSTPYKSPSGRLCFITFELDELAKRFDS